MKRTTITMDGCGRVAVSSDATSVWMSEMELVTLFDVIAPTLRAAIRAVYKSGVLQPCDVERRIRLSNGYYAEGEGNNEEIRFRSRNTAGELSFNARQLFHFHLRHFQHF